MNTGIEPFYIPLYVAELAAAKCAYKVSFRPVGSNFGTP